LTVSEIQAQLGGLTLPQEGQERSPNLSSTGVQLLDGGKTVVLRLPALSTEQGRAVVDQISARVGPLLPEGTSINTIGPTLGSRLLRASLISLLVSFAAIAAYISFRYNGVFAFLALVCLAHDVLITCGVFAWLGLLRGVEVDSLFAVSLITVAGYSVTDTVVVYDRIREQSKALAQLPISEQVDVAVDATLTRSLYTSLTTLLPLFGLIFFGGSSLFWFAVALAIGIAVGSWSSIGLAPTLLPLFSARSAR
jgi:preprotein translocase subunit SecF